MNPIARTVAAVAVAALATLAPSRPAAAGGAWVPAPGEGDFQVGFSRKTAHTSWDAGGESFVNSGRANNHDFRYGYLSGEVGMLPRLSATFLVTYLHGLEGPPNDLEENSGLSDAWFGLKMQLRRDELPMALALTVRTPELYDIDGPYERDLHDDEGNFVGHSPEWRGLLKHDVTLSYLVSRSLRQGGWVNLETGYTWCEGAPADKVPVLVDSGLRLPWRDSAVKLSAIYVQSVGNDSPRQPDDRFGSRPGFNFNDASMGRVGASFIVPLGSERSWTAETGYNLWVWGRSARQYEEPFLSLGRRF